MTPGALTLLIAIPLCGAAVVAAVDARAERPLRTVGFVTMLVAFLVAAWVWLRFAPGVPGLQLQERAPSVPAVGMTYHLGVDGFSVSLVALVSFLFPIALAASAQQVRDHVKPFVITLLLQEAGLLGTFLAQDLILFYVFWEAMLIPMYFLIALWGGIGRGPAAIKFFLYTMAGSVLMLLAIIAVYLASAHLPGGPTFDLPVLLAHPLGLGGGEEALLFLAFAVAFAIKMPVWPLHTWLPDAYAASPPVVTVLLAGLMAKAGAYGLLRFCLPLFPDAARSFGPLLSGLAVVGILYGGAIAWTQRDMRRLLAYGSMSHMGFILLGIFALDVTAMQGSLIQMINHGISTGALFIMAGLLLDRTGRARTDEYGGIASLVPAMSAVTVILVLSSLALPGTTGFIGEFLILLGTFQTRPAAAVVGTVGVVVAVAYLLGFVGRVFHGPVREDLRGLPDLRPREYALFVPLVLVIFWVGLYPRPFLDRSAATVGALVGRISAAAPSVDAARTPFGRDPGLVPVRGGSGTRVGPGPGHAPGMGATAGSTNPVHALGRPAQATREVRR